jgi:hypothetical protein
MRVRWTGPRVVRRIVGAYEWSLPAGWVQDVPEELALDLVTTPGERFELVDEPGQDSSTGLQDLED